jgi:two-component system nitrogen regulation response regulator GlnG
MQPSTREKSNVTTRIFPSLRALIVDDEALIRWALSKRFSQAGYEVCEASDGASALAHFRPGAPRIDLVLQDVNLPDANGIELLTQIKRLCCTCRVVLMTAFDTPATLEEARRGGAYEVLPKPFDIDDMLETAQRGLV